jgi:hypothetical protein
VHPFSVTVTGSNGCKAAALSLVDFKDCTGMEEWIGNVRFSVYPVPNDGRFTVALFSRESESVSLKIIDSKGGTVYHQSGVKVNGELRIPIVLKTITAGNYLLILEKDKLKIDRKLAIIN